MLTNKLTLSLLIIFIFLMVQNLAFGQSTQATVSDLSWQELTPEQSNQQLHEYYNDYKNVFFDWEVEIQEAYLQKGLNASKRQQDDSLAYAFTYELGNLCLYKDSLFKAMDYANEALTLAHNNKYKVIIYDFLAFVFSELDDYKTAIDYYLKSVELEYTNNPLDKAFSFVGISSVYLDIEDYKNSAKYAHQSYYLSSQMASTDKEYLSLFSYVILSKCYSKTNQSDSAQYYVDLAINTLPRVDTIKSQRMQEVIKMTYVQAIEWYLDAGMSELALYYLNKVKPYKLVYAKIDVAILSARYEIQQGNLNGALNILEKIELEEEHFRNKKKVFRLLIQCYKKLNQPNKVSETYEELLQLQDDKVKRDRNRDVLLADVKYETFRKNEEIKSLRLDKKVNSLALQVQRYIIVLAILIAIILLGIALFMRKRAQDRKNLSEYLQEQVKERTKELEQANYELRTFNYIASHDIKEPIRNVGNYAGLIFRKLPDDLKNSLGFYFDTIKRSTSQLYTLVEDFAKYTTLSKDDTIEQQEVDLNTLIYGIEQGLSESIEKYNGQVIQEDLPTISSSTSLLYTALKNLIENGLKYNKSAVPTVKIQYHETPTHHQITVSDNGIGIEEEYHEKIFEMFKRLHNRGEYEGSGIGLAIVKLCVDKLDGKVKLESKVGKGSRFVLLLPR